MLGLGAWTEYSDWVFGLGARAFEVAYTKTPGTVGIPMRPFSVGIPTRNFQPSSKKLVYGHSFFVMQMQYAEEHPDLAKQKWPIGRSLFLIFEILIFLIAERAAF